MTNRIDEKQFKQAVEFVFEDKKLMPLKIRDFYPRFWFIAILWLLAFFVGGFWLGWYIHKLITLL